MLRRTLNVFFLASALTLALPAKSHALDHNLRTILVGAVWGAAAGTVVGLATYPLHQSIKGIFLGSSIGLYSGAGLGAFYAFNKRPEGSPLGDNNTTPSRGGGGIVSTPPRIALVMKVLEF